VLYLHEIQQRLLMVKKIATCLCVIVLCVLAFSNCKKSKTSNADPTRLYFPTKIGTSVTYDVDSIIYIDTTCKQLEIRSQMMYAITDTFRDTSNTLSYIMNVYTRPYDGGFWKPLNVILVVPRTNRMEVVQDENRFVKMMFPVSNGVSWPGNQYIEIQDSARSYFANWNYKYQNVGLQYDNGYVNYANTVTVLEDDETVNNPGVDTAILSYRTYAKEVYAYGVGMIYREWTHWVYNPDTTVCVRGYQVTMRATGNN
jgi:hypothetical protein